jgi:hypothetical protein
MTATPSATRREQLLNMMNELNDESDRAVAVLIGAFLDELLKDLIVTVAKTEPDKLDDLLFVNLGTFATRIDGVYKLNLLSKNEQQDFHRIREARNIFAHEFVGVTFETPEIQKLCQRLTGAKIGGRPASARECFIKAAVRLMVNLHTQVQNRISP